jgi:hypothetical protein
MHDAHSFFEWWRSDRKGVHGDGSYSTGPQSDWPPSERQEETNGDGSSSRDVRPDWVPEEPDEEDVTSIDDFDIDSEMGRDCEETTNDVSTEEYGFEAIAWYRPFHRAGAACGIYIRPVGISIYARRLEACLGVERTEASLPLEIGGELRIDASSLDRTTLNRLALETILQHEWFHHQVELLGYYIEDILDDFRYPEYQRSVYWNHYAGKDCIEESLANAAAARSMRCADLLKKAYSGSNPNSVPSWPTVLQCAVQIDPPAYREFARFAGNPDFRNGCEELTTQIAEGGSNSQPVPNKYLGERLLFDTLPDIDHKTPELPIYIVN